MMNQSTLEQRGINLINGIGEGDGALKCERKKSLSINGEVSRSSAGSLSGPGALRVPSFRRTRSSSSIVSGLLASSFTGIYRNKHINPKLGRERV